MRFLLPLWYLFLIFTAGSAGAQSDEDVYKEPDGFEYQEKPALPESDVVIPPWPVLANSIEVSLGIDDFPFTLFIDPASLSVDRGRVVRYTAILKSVNAAMNVSYEAINCADDAYRRYAFGSGNVLKPVGDSHWIAIMPRGMERFRHVLMGSYLCPVPGKDPVKRLIKRLRTDRSTLLQDQQEE